MWQETKTRISLEQELANIRGETEWMISELQRERDTLATKLTALEELVLSRNGNMTAAARTKIADAIMARNREAGGSVSAIAAGAWSLLPSDGKTVDMTSKGLDDADAMLVAAALFANRVVTSLDLSSNSITTKGITALHEAKKAASQLRELRLGGQF